MDKIETQLHKLINRPKNISFLADLEIGLVTIQYDQDGDRKEEHRLLEDFKTYMKIHHRDYLAHYNLCKRGEPLYNWSDILWELPESLPQAIYDFLIIPDYK